MRPSKTCTPAQNKEQSNVGLIDDRNQMFGSKSLAGRQLLGHRGQAAWTGSRELDILEKCAFV